MSQNFDNPIDHPFDLGFVNFVKHPSDSNYVVFRFADHKRAADFQNELELKKIWFERDTEMKRTIEVVLFGIHKTDFKKAQDINFLVEGRHKKPIIPFKGLRYTVLIIGFGILTLAIVGYCKAQKTIKVTTEQSTSSNVVYPSKK